ncbi:replicative DNA helicase [Parvibaculum sp.]|jgi:replicative DNA helicase|nr:replicative DNA helicase [Parvibaculum sp.]MAU60531.1 replicative DNA helicase [Parvibaculum sp.]MBO6667412.1 replicative DNA helicase [Parvibaculum sp.]MBO6692378.1 replicative DNA helicase [Parvibaculum sp.]MBO6713964.1 replicative DNA helicase [Parvibaculum sp.]|tara:strand:+ start:1429 stop:2919 length:1491 start_codon:yes stop_codon:yes gene_type:complete
MEQTAAYSPSPDDETHDAYRVPPHNIDAEQALLGAILVNNESYDRVASFLDPIHFFDAVHGRIYEAAAKLITGGHLASPVTLKNFFERDEALAEIGGPAYLARLAGAATTIINAEEYGRTIYDLAIRRELIRVGTDIHNRAYDAPVDDTPSAQILEAEQALYQLAEQGKYEGGFQSFHESLKTAIDMAAEAYKRDGGLSGISTGLRDLDHRLGGLQPSDLIILAGRPSMGKTALATNIAFQAAKAYKAEHHADGTVEAKDGAIVGFFSLEMSAEQLATRLLAEQSGVPSERIRRGNIHEDEFHQLVDAAQQLQSIPLYIDDTGGLTIGTLAARARRLKRQRGLGLLVIDYLQLLAGSGKFGDNRVQEVTQITTGLKALAKELNVPVIALSQLSRQVEAREDKRPQLADLRESGSIEQDADVVMFVFREEYYVSRREPTEGTPEHLQWQEEMERVHGLAECIIGKQRHGPTGTVKLQFQADVTRFSDLDQVHTEGFE